MNCEPNHAGQYDGEIYPDEESSFNEDPDGYVCMSCGRVQSQCNGYKCNVCYSATKGWYS